MNRTPPAAFFTRKLTSVSPSSNCSVITPSYWPASSFPTWYGKSTRPAPLAFASIRDGTSRSKPCQVKRMPAWSRMTP
ncbi:MAG: hypothetical protein A2177_03330 [Spirochaetes bacterium RBG_13_68_11]|nr:MAG: hypothetical protein A2177_03330 [Spirochaetes bacterium RBG_13_68_11]